MTTRYFCAKCYVEVQDGEDDGHGECENCHAILWHMGGMLDESEMTMAMQETGRKMREWADLQKGET